MADTTTEARSVSGILATAVHTYRCHFGSLTKAAAVVVPGAAAIALVRLWLLPLPDSSNLDPALVDPAAGSALAVKPGLRSEPFCSSPW